MAHIKRWIELDGRADDIHEQWLRFEALPRCPAHALKLPPRWRAEVLTFHPVGERTRVEMKIEFEPTGAEAALPRSLDAVLQSFLAFLGRDREAAAQPQTA
jgi:hypothetical protein